MNAHAPIEADIDAVAETALAIIEPATALSVLTDPKEFDAFYDRVKATTETLVPDVSTAKGRDEIRAMARKVVTSKTMIDKAGLGLTEEWRANTDKVNASRRIIKEKLDALRDEVRAPLTAWEEADKARDKKVKDVLARLQEAAVVSIEDTADTVRARLAEIQAIEITPDVFQEYEAASLATQETTSATLTAAVARLEREAADRAELERHREAEAKRLADEEAQRIAAQAQAEQERAEAERQEREAEQARVKATRDEEARVAEEARVNREREEREAAAARAAADAQAETERKAAEQMAEQQRQHEAEVARLEQEAQARITQAAAAERAREAEAKRIADEAAAEQQALAARTKDREHRGQVMGEAKAAIMAVAGIKEEAAKKLVLAFIAEEVPHVSFSF